MVVNFVGLLQRHRVTPDECHLVPASPLHFELSFIPLKWKVNMRILYRFYFLFIPTFSPIKFSHGWWVYSKLQIT